MTLLLKSTAFRKKTNIFITFLKCCFLEQKKNHVLHWHETPWQSSKRLILSSNLYKLPCPNTVAHHFLAFALQYTRSFRHLAGKHTKTYIIKKQGHVSHCFFYFFFVNFYLILNFLKSIHQSTRITCLHSYLVLIHFLYICCTND